LTKHDRVFLHPQGHGYFASCHCSQIFFPLQACLRDYCIHWRQCLHCLDVAWNQHPIARFMPIFTFCITFINILVLYDSKMHKYKTSAIWHMQCDWKVLVLFEGGRAWSDISGVGSRCVLTSAILRNRAWRSIA
jgi:hypothetical protein